MDRIIRRNKLVIGEYSFKRVFNNKEKFIKMKGVAENYIPKENDLESVVKIKQDYKTGKEMSNDRQYDGYNQLSLEGKLDLFIKPDTNAKTRGVLAGKINEHINDINLYQSAKDAYDWKYSANKSTKIVLVPQTIYLNGRDGKCLPASILMGRALQNGTELTLTKNLMDIYSTPGVHENPLNKSLNELHANGNSSKFSSVEILDINVNSLTKAKLKLFPADNVSIRVDIPQHTMLISKVARSGKIKYVFYDPNYGLAYFDKYKHMIEFFKKKVADYGIPEDSITFRSLDYSQVQEIKINKKNIDEIISGGTQPETAL